MKRFTLLAAALLLCGLSMNAQSSCATAQALTVADDASSTETVASLSGDPTPINISCITANDGVTNDQNGVWYSYTPTQDIIVTVTTNLASNGTPNETGGNPDPAFYYPTLEIYTGSCSDLTAYDCDAGGPGDGVAEVAFLARTGTTYYVVFNDLLAQLNAGTTTAFDFEISTSTDLSVLPGVASNPTPADGATKVSFYNTQDAQGNTVTAMDFAWDAPTTGGAVEGYLIEIDTDPNFGNPIAGTFDSNTITGLHLPGQNYFTANTTYYWRVTPLNSYGPTIGTIQEWSYTTGTLGIEDNNLSEISFYPNPVVDVLNISVPSSIELESVTMFDLLGKQTQVSISENNTINMSQMAAGVYILKLETNQGTMTKKIIKN